MPDTTTARHPVPHLTRTTTPVAVTYTTETGYTVVVRRAAARDRPWLTGQWDALRRHELPAPGAEAASEPVNLPALVNGLRAVGLVVAPNPDDATLPFASLPFETLWRDHVRPHALAELFLDGRFAVALQVLMSRMVDLGIWPQPAPPDDLFTTEDTRFLDAVATVWNADRPAEAAAQQPVRALPHTRGDLEAWLPHRAATVQLLSSLRQQWGAPALNAAEIQRAVSLLVTHLLHPPNVSVVAAVLSTVMERLQQPRLRAAMRETVGAAGAPPDPTPPGFPRLAVLDHLCWDCGGRLVRIQDSPQPDTIRARCLGCGDVTPFRPGAPLPCCCWVGPGRPPQRSHLRCVTADRLYAVLGDRDRPAGLDLEDVVRSACTTRSFTGRVGLDPHGEVRVVDLTRLPPDLTEEDLNA